jgi:putative endonuclease
MTVLARNWRCREGEVDIVALDGDAVVFCEVKTRRSLAFGAAVEAVDRRKAAQVRRLAARWLDEHRGDLRAIHGRVIRFDVIAVTLRPGGPLVEHLAAAF